MNVLSIAAASFSEVAAFHPHFDVLGLLLALVVGFEYGVRRLAEHHAPRGEPAVTRRQRLLFHSGLLTLLVTSSWPIHDLAESSLYSVHMVQHMGMTLVAPPLLLYGIPWWLLRLAVRPILPVVRVLTKPLVALFAFNAVLGLVHVPAFVELSVTSELFHFGMHTVLFTTATMMWWPIIGPIPDLPRLEPFPRMGYLFLQSLVPTIPASFLTLGETPLYPIYETFPRLWGISALTDQVVAGLIMKLGGGLILWGFIAGVFFTWWAEEQRHGRSPIRTVTKV